MNGYLWRARQGLTLERIDWTGELPASMLVTDSGPHQATRRLGIHFCLHSDCLTKGTVKGQTLAFIVYATGDEWARDLEDIKRAAYNHPDVKAQVRLWLATLN
jgi:hypothetical protein